MKLTTWLRAATAAIGSTVFLLGAPFLLSAPAVHADELDDLRNAVESQGKLIEALQGEVGDLKSSQDESTDSGAVDNTDQANSTNNADNATDSASSDSTAAEGGVTPEDVDQRIQDFETAPASRFMVSGYGTVEYIGIENDPSGFGVSFNPGFHYRMSDRLHFNGELELELERDPGSSTATDVGLEFAQIDFLLNDWMVLSGGYFLAPFNTFGQRLHPNWINKLASRPILYGGTGIIPVIKQVGAMVSGGAPMWGENSKFTYSFYAVNSPSLNGDGTNPDANLDIDFASTPNFGSNIAGGGRVGFLPVPNLEIGGSFQTGELDNTGNANNNNRYTLFGADLWYRWRDLELRGEFMRLDRESTNATSNGYYIQAAYRLRSLFPTSESAWSLLGRVEPVIRWSQIASFDPKDREQLAVGVAFWVYESAPLKFTYERNTGTVKDDRYIVQFAYGF